MHRRPHIKPVPHYQELLDLLAEVYFSINGDYPQLKERIKRVLEDTEPEKLFKIES